MKPLVMLLACVSVWDGVNHDLLCVERQDIGGVTTKKKGLLD